MYCVTYIPSQMHTHNMYVHYKYNTHTHTHTHTYTIHTHTRNTYTYVHMHTISIKTHISLHTWYVHTCIHTYLIAGNLCIMQISYISQEYLVCIGSRWAPWAWPSASSLQKFAALKFPAIWYTVHVTCMHAWDVCVTMYLNTVKLRENFWEQG